MKAMLYWLHCSTPPQPTHTGLRLWYRLYHMLLNTTEPFAGAGRGPIRTATACSLLHLKTSCFLRSAGAQFQVNPSTKVQLAAMWGSRAFLVMALQLWKSLLRVVWPLYYLSSADLISIQRYFIYIYYLQPRHFFSSKHIWPLQFTSHWMLMVLCVSSVLLLLFVFNSVFCF